MASAPELLPELITSEDFFDVLDLRQKIGRSWWMSGHDCFPSLRFSIRLDGLSFTFTNGLAGLRNIVLARFNTAELCLGLGVPRWFNSLRETCLC